MEAADGDEDEVTDYGDFPAWWLVCPPFLDVITGDANVHIASHSAAPIEP